MILHILKYSWIQLKRPVVVINIYFVTTNTLIYNKCVNGLYSLKVHIIEI